MPPIPIPTAVATLRERLQAQLGWGESVSWSNYDFEQLSEQVSCKTGVSLSISTLKRVLGKVDYKSSPSLTTLNTLSQFLDYSDWRDFQRDAEQNTAIPNGKNVELPPTKKLKKLKHWITLALGGMVLIGTVSFLVLRNTSYTPNDFQFSSITVLTKGLPNSVVFNFDATKANEDDSVFICQSWDTRRKVPVNRSDKHHSAIYYYPGYYRAKLMIGPQVVKEHDIQINTDGWLGTVEAEWGQEPVYFRPSDIITGRMVGVTSELLRKYHLETGPSVPKILLFNQQNLHGIMTNEFRFETEVKVENATGASSCQRIEVLLQARNDILIVPLANPGCIGDIYLAAYGYFADSRTADLSGFGCHPTEWTKLKIICSQGLMRFYVDEREVYKTSISNKPTEIVGVQFRFNGPGTARNTEIQGTTGKVIF